MNKEERKKDRKEKGEKIDILIEQLHAQQQQIQKENKI